MQASNARALLRRLHPWIGKAVHTHWSRRRGFYQEESEALLLALVGVEGRIPVSLALRLEVFLGRLYREWFPQTWRREPTYVEVIADFRWWLQLAEGWGAERPRGTKARAPRPAKRGPLARQPEKLLKLLSLPRDCTKERFLTAWRRYVKRHHPDLNPNQSPEERRRFAEAVALWRR